GSNCRDRRAGTKGPATQLLATASPSLSRCEPRGPSMDDGNSPGSRCFGRPAPKGARAARRPLDSVESASARSPGGPNNWRQPLLMLVPRAQTQAPIPTDLGDPPPRSIVMLRALQLGDLLCTVPVFRAIRRAFPDAEISLIGLPWARELIDRLPGYIDELI